MDEEVLAGGNSILVVRVGDTVRRPAGPWTPAVHQLLITLRAAGVTEVPEPFGLDELGREMLSFRPGVVGNYPLPDWLWSPAILHEAGRLRAVLRAAADQMMDLAGFTDQRAADTGRSDFADHAALYRRDGARFLEMSARA